ncbi:MAG: hypothetical protein NT005_01525 [Spirochaetes bacterium]|nr:hypothetical protein [Spirochaetota bacterium]
MDVHIAWLRQKLAEKDRTHHLLPVLYSNSYFGLAEGLSELFGCRVDLVEENAIRNPFFREAVEAAKERIYGVA